MIFNIIDIMKYHEGNGKAVKNRLELLRYITGEQPDESV